MKKIIAVFIVLTYLLTGCEGEQAKTESLSKLTCKDSPIERSKEEQTAIADACFRSGNFVKSSGKEW